MENSYQIASGHPFLLPAHLQGAIVTPPLTPTPEALHAMFSVHILNSFVSCSFSSDMLYGRTNIHCNKIDMPLQEDAMVVTHRCGRTGSV